MTSLPAGPDDRARRFLIACLAGARSPSLFDEARQAAAEGLLDWRVVEAMAVEEKVAPLIYRATRDHDLLPDWLADSCRRAWLETGLINKLRLEDLAAALDRLAARRIDTIVLKGVALAHTVYDTVALRPMIDVDLLVRRDCSACVDCFPLGIKGNNPMATYRECCRIDERNIAGCTLGASRALSTPLSYRPTQYTL